ncbi:DNA binding domain-containing protein, excisionase family [Quadrisphaera granulorum]|uniref:Excisionase family DNA binding protein n=1 Tax=Quadrisphaera granulorum TaxID=317664 RepID=A0A316B1P9_9ACTN|nr:helix-turn-helix domain-containing protein [Quadrisphaera granulorum]PWJ56487.1 excisionase family DNA binding protein [Quadrisphaera granulorum]SZE95121.1 DNA binding domain-containing protein, excisionase family [Quadrisphaera granulorum]
MRSFTFDQASASASDDLLTTGEAATMLGVSRQHIVNLCDRGDLAYVTSGAHRRITRAELEAFAARSARMTRDQRRSLWLSYAVAGRLVEEPEATLATARHNLARLQERHTRGQAARWLAEWEHLLDGPLEAVLHTLTSTSPRARELRQNSPFAGVLDERTRERVRANFSDHDRAARAPAR